MLESKERVLVVDDEPQILLALEDLLSSDFDVLKSESGPRALELLDQDDEIAVVVSDQRMPSMNGDELLLRIHQRWNATGILLTGYADVSSVVRAVNDASIFAYVTKPWNSDDLKLKIQKAVEHFRLSCDLARERQLLRDLMDNVPDCIYFKDAELRFQRVNRAFATVLGSPAETFVGKRLADVMPEREAAVLEAEERGVLSNGVPKLDALRSFGHGHGQRWFSVNKSPIRNKDGNAVGLIGIARDVTERRHQEEKIARLTRVYAITAAINEVITRTDDARVLLEESCRIAVELGGFVVASVAELGDGGTAAQELRGWPLDHPAILALSRALDGKILPDGVLAEVLGTRLHVVLNDIATRPDSRLKTELLAAGLRSAAIFPLAVGGEVTHVFGLCSDRANPFDVEEIKLLTELADNLSYALAHIGNKRRLAFLAYHDALTQLPNRALLLDRLQQQIASAERNGTSLAVLVLDMARLRQINETLGRRGGDALLLDVARRLREALPREVTLARFEGSSFAVLVPEVGDVSSVAVLIQGSILDPTRTPFVVDGTELRISFRVGIAVAPADANEGDALLAKAENALKNAKARAQAYLFYAPTMNERVAEKLALETKLRRALENEEFVLHYQPKVELREGEIVGLEALIRWQDPERGLVPPGRFIPILEETGMILEVGRWALRHAALQYREWLRAGLAPPRIAVNVSAVQLAAPDFVATLVAVLDEAGGPCGVDLEITESVFVDNLIDSVEKLRAARERGLKVAIDDFGTGYSSLGYLTRLPIDSLKIDRSFIVGMADDPQEMAIVTTIISLARSMDLCVVAEGVETQAQARLLRLIKCNELQGYLFSKPKPAVEIPALLRTKLDLASSAAAKS